MFSRPCITGAGFAVFFVDALTGWAVGDRTILHTADGGLTWAEQPTGLDPAPTSLTDVAFADAQRGWIAGGQGLILHTADGGASWNVQDSGTTNALLGVDFFDAVTGWISGEGGTILRFAVTPANAPPVVIGPLDDDLLRRAACRPGPAGGVRRAGPPRCHPRR